MAFNIDDLDQGLAADFDSNLTGLGTELGTSAYNMSEVLAVFKQEEEEEEGFQYILCAATSPAVKLSEETLTYLNQGQSYELKLKKLGNSDSCGGKVLKSAIRVLFHDKRLQYTEKEQLAEWKSQRPGDRILDIDVPLSYGVLQYIRSPTALNTVELIWDPAKSAGAFIQVHCISTEFTPKKHGGEKGVPFRVQVDTYLHTQDTDQHLHSGSCQVKVFKPKGADRKHKTDRERMEKKSDRDKYQPSYEYTVLTSCTLGATSMASTVASMYDSNDGFNSSYEHVLNSPSSSIDAASVVTAAAATPTSQVSGDLNDTLITEPLLPTATSQQTQEWLTRNRFSAYRKLFLNFTGADLLTLSRDDLIQILGLADGIRLNNALQERHVRPRLAIYVSQESDQIYHAMYLENPSSEELKTKVAQLYNVGMAKISQVVRQAPSGIRVLVSDEMVQTFEDESSFSIEALKDEGRETYTVVLK